ncbi:MAG: DUF4386 domain-containing protein [Acidobacteria bacterium]|nr:DUF4386 domain-containing protein [Acidobacteriota bacterium]
MAMHEDQNNERRAAIVAGICVLAGMIAGVFSVVPSVDDPGYLLNVADAWPEVLRGAFFQLLMAPAYLGFALALYPVLRRHDPALAVGFIGSRFVAVAFILCGAIILPLFVTLSRAFLQAGAPEGSAFQVLGELLRTWRDLVNHVAMVIASSLGALLFNLLLLRTRLLPAWLAAWGLAGAALAVAASLLVLFGSVPVVSSLYLVMNAPMAAQELVLALLLVVKGFGPAPRGELVASRTCRPRESVA